MPIRSKAQRRFLWAVHPDIARRWEKHTPKGVKLPEHVGAAMSGAQKLYAHLSAAKKKRIKYGEIHPDLDRKGSKWPTDFARDFGIAKNPLPQVPDEEWNEKHPAWIWNLAPHSDKLLMRAESTLMDLPVSKLVTPQSYVVRSNVDRVAGDKTPIHVVLHNGQYVVLDGNHRAVDAWRKGKKTIKAHVYKYEPKRWLGLKKEKFVPASMDSVTHRTPYRVFTSKAELNFEFPTEKRSEEFKALVARFLPRVKVSGEGTRVMCRLVAKPDRQKLMLAAQRQGGQVIGREVHASMDFDDTEPIDAPVVGRTLTKRAIVNTLARELNLAQHRTAPVVQGVLDKIAAALLNGQRVELRNFGVFSMRVRRPHKAVDPRTGQPQPDKDEQFFVHFQPSKGIHKPRWQGMSYSMDAVPSQAAAEPPERSGLKLDFPDEERARSFAAALLRAVPKCAVTCDGTCVRVKHHSQDVAAVHALMAKMSKVAPSASGISSAVPSTNTTAGMSGGGGAAVYSAGQRAKPRPDPNTPHPDPNQVRTGPQDAGGPMPTVPEPPSMPESPAPRATWVYFDGSDVANAAIRFCREHGGKIKRPFEQSRQVLMYGEPKLINSVIQKFKGSPAPPSQQSTERHGDQLSAKKSAGMAHEDERSVVIEVPSVWLKDQTHLTKLKHDGLQLGLKLRIASPPRGLTGKKQKLRITGDPQAVAEFLRDRMPGQGGAQEFPDPAKHGAAGKRALKAAGIVAGAYTLWKLNPEAIPTVLAWLSGVVSHVRKVAGGIEILPKNDKEARAAESVWNKAGRPEPGYVNPGPMPGSKSMFSHDVAMGLSDAFYESKGAKKAAKEKEPKGAKAQGQYARKEYGSSMPPKGGWFSVTFGFPGKNAAKEAYVLVSQQWKMKTDWSAGTSKFTIFQVRGDQVPRLAERMQYQFGAHLLGSHPVEGPNINPTSYEEKPGRNLKNTFVQLVIDFGTVAATHAAMRLLQKYGIGEHNEDAHLISMGVRAASEKGLQAIVNQLKGRVLYRHRGDSEQAPPLSPWVGKSRVGEPRPDVKPPVDYGAVPHMKPVVPGQYKKPGPKAKKEYREWLKKQGDPNIPGFSMASAEMGLLNPGTAYAVMSFISSGAMISALQALKGMGLAVLKKGPRLLMAKTADATSKAAVRKVASATGGQVLEVVGKKALDRMPGIGASQDVACGVFGNVTKAVGKGLLKGGKALPGVAGKVGAKAIDTLKVGAFAIGLFALTSGALTALSAYLTARRIKHWVSPNKELIIEGATPQQKREIKGLIHRAGAEQGGHAERHNEDVRDVARQYGHKHVRSFVTNDTQHSHILDDQGRPYTYSTNLKTGRSGNTEGHIGQAASFAVETISQDARVAGAAFGVAIFATVAAAWICYKVLKTLGKAVKWVGKKVLFIDDEPKNRGLVLHLGGVVKPYSGGHGASFSVALSKYPWTKCVSDMKKKYGSEESARRVCGKIKANRGAAFSLVERIEARRRERQDYAMSSGSYTQIYRTYCTDNAYLVLKMAKEAGLEAQLYSEGRVAVTGELEEVQKFCASVTSKLYGEMLQPTENIALAHEMEELMDLHDGSSRVGQALRMAHRDLTSLEGPVAEGRVQQYKRLVASLK